MGVILASKEHMKLHDVDYTRSEKELLKSALYWSKSKSPNRLLLWKRKEVICARKLVNKGLLKELKPHSDGIHVRFNITSKGKSVLKAYI